MRDRLECNARGDCVSIFCEPNKVDASLLSGGRLAASWTASWSDIECKKVREIVISTSKSKTRSNNPSRHNGTHDRQLYPESLPEIVTESSSKKKTKRMVQCYIWVYVCMSARRTKGRIWILCAQHLKNRARQIFDEQCSQSCIRWSLKEESGSAPDMIRLELTCSCIKLYQSLSSSPYAAMISLGWVKKPWSFTSTR